MSYGPFDSTAPETAALCPSCAALLTPFRFAVDLARIRSVTDPDATCREVAKLVEHVVAMRSEPPTDVVWTRARDAHLLARRLATTRTHLAMQLRGLGVLVAVEIVTKDRPGSARRTRTAHGALA